ncbi:MAG: methyl-accepting chemotaxis protein [Lachnospiraceae bacterium]|nr:methyl-accepting chemotaxis protein [Lachnospiraceae bacterium]
MKNIRMAAKISMISIAVLILGLVGLWFTANQQMTKTMEESIVKQLRASVEMQAEIVRNYVDKAETYLVGYAQAPVLAKALQKTEDGALAAELQEYTDAYAVTGDNLENIYAADYNSTVIASRVQGVIGVTLREGDALKQLQNAIAQGMYNTGIMASKSTGAQVISMYYPVNDAGGEPLGYVGAAIYAENLRDTLNGLSDKEEGCDYLLLDAASGSYIFCPEDEMIGTVIENTDVLNIVEQAKNVGNQAKAFEYTDGVTGKRIISAIYYLEERDWVLVALTDWDIAFSEVRALTGMLAVLCLAVLVIISLAVWGCVAVLARDISREADIIQNIGTLDFTERQKLERYCGRKDEVGMIADAMKVLVDAMYQVVEGLKKKCGELLEMAGEMSGTSSSASGTIRSVETAIQEIAEGAGNQAAETENASECVIQIGNQIAKTKEKSSRLSDVAEQISNSSEEALETLQLLVGINEQAKNAVEEINKQTLNTNESVQKIRDAAQLITSIAEETNLLSLNASIEAARAGDQGSGFAVVAGQIKKLAEQSNDSAKYIDKIIEALLEESSRAVQVMDEVKNIMKMQSEHLSGTKDRFGEVGHSVEVTQREIMDIDSMISHMDKERIGVIDIVQGLTAIAEENAAGTQEALASTEMVNGMIKDVADVAKELAELANAIESDIDIFKV